MNDVIEQVISTTNAGDTKGFVALFSDDAVLNDWGREFHGKEGVASWDSTDNTGKQSHFELVKTETVDDQTSRVFLKVSGNGFNGTSPFLISINDKNEITSFVIEPD